MQSGARSRVVGHSDLNSLICTGNTHRNHLSGSAVVRQSDTDYDLFLDWHIVLDGGPTGGAWGYDDVSEPDTWHTDAQHRSGLHLSGRLMRTNWLRPAPRFPWLGRGGRPPAAPDRPIAAAAAASSSCWSWRANAASASSVAFFCLILARKASSSVLQLLHELGIVRLLPREGVVVDPVLVSGAARDGQDSRPGRRSGEAPGPRRERVAAPATSASSSSSSSSPGGLCRPRGEKSAAPSGSPRTRRRQAPRPRPGAGSFRDPSCRRRRPIQEWTSRGRSAACRGREEGVRHTLSLSHDKNKKKDTGTRRR